MQPEAFVAGGGWAGSSCDCCLEYLMTGCIHFDLLFEGASFMLQNFDAPKRVHFLRQCEMHPKECILLRQVNPVSGSVKCSAFFEHFLRQCEMHPKECIVDWHDGGCGKESGKSFACVHFGILRVCWARQGRVEGSAVIGRSLNTCNPLAPGIVWSRWQLK